ncbi:hypothetical protein LJR027_000237 [Terrabacter sp. LjRoot27]|uniref:hypothetical protein n=1 Tax=Terrabacter sp. LjRoot27 TaxID=3342306 RepID=UPI003ECC97E1
MKRAFVAAAVLAAPLVLGPLTTGSAGAAQPRIYHTIGSTSASAVIASTQGCELTEVFVSSSTAMYAAQPGPVGKQGLTSVFVRVTDTCTSGTGTGTGGVTAAAGGGGGTVIFEADAQNGAPLVVDPRLTRASVTTSLAGTDGDGVPVTVRLAATWTGTGPLEHTTVSNHDHFGDGNVNATDNNLRRDASARVSVQVAGRSATGTATDAVIEQSRSRCIEVPRPGVEGFYPCFGFPG